MEFFGIIAFVAVCYLLEKNTSLKNKVNILDNKLKKLERGGNVQMSKLLNDLVGKECVFMINGELAGINATVMDVDEEFVKLKQETKKHIQTILVRISDISKVTQTESK